MQQNDTTIKPFSEYIVYVDESGDHDLSAITAQYPMFVLTFCIFEKSSYIETICPAIHRFKIQFFGHEATILHEREISRALPPFNFLMNPTTRNSFFTKLNACIEEAPFTVVAIAINKRQYCSMADPRENIYHLAMRRGISCVIDFLWYKQAHSQVTHVIFEKRGVNEDRALTHEFYNSLPIYRHIGGTPQLDVVTVSKVSNVCGLQIADLISRPIGRYLMNPSQPNRAIEIIRKKFWGGTEEIGLIRLY